MIKTRSNRMSRFIGNRAMLGLSCCWLLNLSQAIAGPIATPAAPTISVRIEEPDARTWHYTPSNEDVRPSDDVNNAYELTRPLEFSILGNRTHLKVEELQYDPDPFVLNNVLITNTTTTTQVFSVFVGLPTTFSAPSLISGHVRVSVIDGNSNGATLATLTPHPIYAAQIDGTIVATLQDDPYALVASSGSSAGSPLWTFGPAANAIPVSSSIGIQLQFALTPMDTVSILSRFDVVERGIIVPEPASLGLMLPGLLLARLYYRSTRRSPVRHHAGKKTEDQQFK